MLTQNSRRVAANLIASLMGQVKLEVKPNTPLAMLMNSSLASDSSDITANVNDQGLNVHDEAMNALIDQGHKYLQASMHRARSVVLPMVRDIEDEVLQSVTQHVAGLVEYSIVPRVYPEVLDVPSFIAMADIHGDWIGILNNPMPPGMFPTIDWEHDLDKIKVGIEKIDAAMECKDKEELLRSIYDTWRKDPRAHLGTMNIYHGVKYTTTSFWLVSALLNSQEELGIKIADTQLVYFKALQLWLAHEVRTLVARRERNFEKGQLVLDIAGKTIHVNGDVYNKYLKAGGRPEVIMGGAVRNLTLTRSAAVKEEAEHLEVYDGYARGIESQVKSMRLEAIRTMLPQVFTKYITEHPEYEFDLAKLQPAIHDSMRRMAIASDDLYPSVRQLVCDVLFPNTDTLVVLGRIDDLMKNNPDMDAADAATSCYVSLLVDFYISQLNITKVV